MSESQLEVSVLVAEDNRINQKVIEQQLRMLGYAATICDDGVDALEMLQDRDFSLLLTDCNMPRMDGYDLARKVREREAGTDEHIPIVALTASAVVGEKQKCLEAGMDAMLTKPTDMQLLDQTLGELLLAGVPSAQEVPPPQEVEPSAQQLLIDRAALRGALGDEVQLVSGVLVQFRRFAETIDEHIDDARRRDDHTAIAGMVERLRRAATAVCAWPLARQCEAFADDAKLEDLTALLGTTIRQIRPR